MKFQRLWWTGGVILVGNLLMVSPSMASLEMALFLLQKYIREKEKFFFKMQEEDLRCSYDCMPFLLEKSLLPIWFKFILSWEQNLELCNSRWLMYSL